MHFFHCIFLMDLCLIAPFPEVIPFLRVILRLWILVVSLFQQPPWPSGPAYEIWDGSSGAVIACPCAKLCFLITASICSYPLLCFGAHRPAHRLQFSIGNGNSTSWFKVQKLMLRHHDCICCLRVCGAPGRMAFTPWLGKFSHWVVSLTHLGGWSCPLWVPSSTQSTRNWCDSLKELWTKLVPHYREGLNNFFVLRWLVNSKHFYSVLTLFSPLFSFVLQMSPKQRLKPGTAAGVKAESLGLAVIEEINWPLYSGDK